VTTSTRSSKRYPVALEVEYRRGDVRGRARALNLSMGGMLLDVDAKLDAGDKLQLQFHIPGQKEPVETEATVRWQDGAGTGLQFDGLRARDVWALGRYFESL
jgi:hypothetical protein